MRNKFIIGCLIVLSAIAILFFMDSNAKSTPIYGVLATKEDAVAHLFSFLDRSKNPELIDIRLVYHEDADKAQGVTIGYDKMEGYRYKPDTPMWVITIRADDVTDLPMLEDGKYQGVIFYVDAPDGNIEGYSSVGDLATDAGLARVRALPDLSGQLVIEPLPPVEAPAEVPTATRALETSK